MDLFGYVPPPVKAQPDAFSRSIKGCKQEVERAPAHWAGEPGLRKLATPRRRVGLIGPLPSDQRRRARS